MEELLHYHAQPHGKNWPLRRHYKRLSDNATWSRIPIDHNDLYHKEIVATRDADRRAQLKLQRKEHMSLVKKGRMVYDAMSQDVCLPVGGLVTLAVCHARPASQGRHS